MVDHQPSQPSDHGGSRGVALLENGAQGHSHHRRGLGNQGTRKWMRMGVAVTVVRLGTCPWRSKKEHKEPPIQIHVRAGPCDDQFYHF